MSARPLAALVLAMAVGACTGGPHPVAPTTSPPPGCPDAGDLVSSARPLVHAKPRCGSAFDVSVEHKIPDGTRVSVRPVGGQGGQAQLFFPAVGECWLQQMTPAEPALVENHPSPGILFWQYLGASHCSSLGHTSAFCGTQNAYASIVERGNAQFRCKSSHDLTLAVAVYRGAVSVGKGGARREVAAGEELNVLSGAITPAVFTPDEVALFQRQAVSLGLFIGATPTIPSPPIGPAPRLVGAPSIFFANDGQTLGATLGTWKSATSFAFQWFGGCDDAGASCHEVPGATGSSFVPTCPTDAPDIVVRITAYYNGESTSVLSRPFAAGCSG